MAYIKNTWVDDKTQLNAFNMNNIEDGIEEALDGINKIQTICEKYTDTVIKTSVIDVLNTPV